MILTPAVRNLAGRLGVVARPKADRWHREPVPLLGGVAIFGSFAIVTGLFTGQALLALLVCSAAVFLLGLFDDLWHVNAATKIVGQIAVSGALIHLVPGWHLTGWIVVDYLIALLWLVGITNAFNLLDNVDGLSAGVALLAAVFYLPALWHADAAPVFVAVAAFAGACAAFLIFNFQPASIFMGDGGSLFLGFFLASTTLLVTPELQSRVVAVAAVPVLVLLVPIFDTTFVTLTRRLSGRRVLAGGRDHTSHRLVALGIGERRAVLLLYMLTALGGSIALGMQHLGTRQSIIAIAGYAIVLAGLGVLLGHVHVTPGDADAPLADQPLPGEITARNRIVEVLLDVALIGLAYYAAFAIRFQGEEFSRFLPYFAASFPVVVGCQLAGLWVSGKYRQIWRSFGSAELVTILKGVAFGIAASVILILYLYRFIGFSRSVFVIQAGLLAVLLIGSRVMISHLDEYLLRRRHTGHPVLIYGAGRRGLMLARELLENQALGLIPVGFVDDDPAKQRLRLEGLPVVGTSETLRTLLQRWDPAQLLVSTPDIGAERLKTVHPTCSAAHVSVRRLRFELEALEAEPLLREAAAGDR